MLLTNSLHIQLTISLKLSITDIHTSTNPTTVWKLNELQSERREIELGSDLQRDRRDEPDHDLDQRLFVLRIVPEA